MNEQCAREPQVRELINRLAEMTEAALVTQAELATRISPILRSDSDAGLARQIERDSQMAPMAATLCDICEKVGRLIDRNLELTQKLEI